jgi:predicted DNA-binding transcriptional regulator AlpA
MTRALRADPISYAPRGLSRDEAARYIGVSPSKFDQMIADGLMPKAKRLGGRVVWDRVALDIAFTDLPDDGAEGSEFFTRLFDKRKAG